MEPDHITNDGPEGSSIPHRQLTGVGVCANRELRSLQDAIYARLRHPTSIVEFPPSPALIPGHEIQTVATDSNLIADQLLPTCALLSRASELPCARCNNAVALLFRGLYRPELAGRVPARIKASPLLARYRASIDFRIEVIADEARGRVYVAYDCPLLGYWELAFPVFFADRVIAVFMLGQILRESRLGRIPKVQAAFFASSASGLPPREAEILGQKIREAHDHLVREPGRVLSEPDYHDLLDRALKELERLEDRIRCCLL